MINIPSTFKISFRALRVNKMRSALTMLGIIIGVGAVIAMVAVGTGASQKIAEQISSMGSNLLIILPGATTAGGVRMGAGTQSTLTMGDAEAIVKECPAVADVAPIHNGVAQIMYGHLNWSTGVIGTTPGMLIVRDWELSAGRSFTTQDVKSATKVCLLGQTVVDNLFGEQNPVGQTIRIKNVPFTVIGVLATKGPERPGTGPGRYDHDPGDHGPEEALRDPVPGHGAGSSWSRQRAPKIWPRREADQRTAQAAAPHRPEAGQRFHGAEPHPDHAGARSSPRRS